jgi:transposase
MSHNLNNAVAVIGIDIGKNSFHVVGLDSRGAIVLRQKWSRGRIEARLANMPPCLIGMEACVGAHHLSRKLKAFGHDARLMPAANHEVCGNEDCRTARPASRKNDFRDAEAIAEAVQPSDQVRGGLFRDHALEQRQPQHRLADELTQDVASRRHDRAGVSIAEQPFDGHMLRERGTAARPHRRRSDGDGGVSCCRLGFEDAQHGRLAGMLEVIDHVVDARRKPVRVDLHGCKKRAQCRQAFAEALAHVYRHRRLLRVSCEWPSDRHPACKYEIAPPHGSPQGARIWHYLKSISTDTV